MKEQSNLRQALSDHLHYFNICKKVDKMPALAEKAPDSPCLIWGNVETQTP